MPELLQTTELMTWTELLPSEETTKTPILLGQDLGYGLDLSAQDSTLTRASTVNVWGYNGDPSASNGPQLISVPSNVQAITGARWTGSKFVTTTTSGQSLSPYTLKSTNSGNVKVFTAFANHAVSTAYASGAQVRIKTSAGNYVYMTSSGGTSSGTAPTVVDGDSTVTDNDITWSVEGYCTIEGELLEDASTNLLTYSNDLSNAAWTLRGTAAAVQNITGADGVANSGWTVSGIASGNNDVFQAKLLTAVRHEAAVVMKQISTSGVIYIQSVTDPANRGQWQVDLSKLKTYWEVVDRNHPAVTVITEFGATGTPSGIWFAYSSGTGPLSFGYHNSKLELGTSSTSQIYTAAATATRAATTLSDTSAGRLTAESGAIRIKCNPISTGSDLALFSMNDGTNDNRTVVRIDSTESRGELIMRSGGALLTSVFTLPATLDFSKQICVDVYWDGTSEAIRAFNIGESAPSFTTSTVGASPYIGSVFYISSGDVFADASSIVASVELSTNKEDFGW